jgi:AcrR family transcriptional regulator
MKKKEAILKTAARLFAIQGFDGTPTIQIAREAGVTEPLIFYYFNGKDDLFRQTQNLALKIYFEHLDILKSQNGLQFDKIEKLIDLHFKIVQEMPENLYLLISICPMRFNDNSDNYDKNNNEFHRRLMFYLMPCLEKGIANGEFAEIPVESTASLLVAMINGLVQQQFVKNENLDNMKKTAIDFCRRSLIHNQIDQSKSCSDPN